jgi:ribosomal protein S18 acetylase RimI-like enzyme
MPISSSISRLTAYYNRNGLVATIRRAGLALKRSLFSSRMIVFYCDLGKLDMAPVKPPNSLRVECLRSYADLSQRDLREMTGFWNPKQAHRNIRERFEKGASLWLIKSEDKLAGYGWTLLGHTIAPYYFPLTSDDVHLFDFHVLTQYRGRGLNPFLVSQILRSLATAGRGRAFIEAAEWNQAQLASLEKTPFHRLGMARSSTILRHTFVSWVGNEPIVPKMEGAKRKDAISSMATSHER